MSSMTTRTNIGVNKDEDLFISQIIKSTGIFVSVGCGMGVLEKKLIEAGKILICIDPNDYDKKDRYTQAVRVLKPNYKYVSNLLEDRPNIVGKVNLILIHPLPDYALYDIMSIVKLEPKRIFLYYMKDGGAGSWLLHRFLRRNGVNSSAKLKTDDNILERFNISKDICPVKHKYKQVYENNIIEHNTNQCHTYSILDRQEIHNNIPISINCEANLEDKEEFVLIGNDNIQVNFINCIKYLHSLYHQDLYTK